MAARTTTKPYWFEQKGWRRVGSTVAWLLSAAGAVGAVVFGTLAGSDSDERTKWLWLAGLCTVIPLVASGLRSWIGRKRRERLNEQVVEASATLITAIVAWLNPCLMLLGKMTKVPPEARSEILGQLAQAVTNAAAHLCGPHGQDVRAVLFKAEGRTMSQLTYSGSSKPSPRTFTNRTTDIAGKAAWDWAREGAAKLWENLDEEQPVGFTKSRTTTYQTFITCGVKNGEELYGMLNVDAPRTGDLGERDVELVSALARMLAVGNALCKG